MAGSNTMAAFEAQIVQINTQFKEMIDILQLSLGSPGVKIQLLDPSKSDSEPLASTIT